MARTYALCALFAVFAALACPAQAHQDQILPVAADGAITVLPPKYGPVNLTLEGLGSVKPLVQLRIGANQTTLPFCVTRLIRSRNLKDVLVTGSWYHDEEGGLPYYVKIQFFEPGYDRKKSLNSNLKFVFNLHDAKLIYAKAFEVDSSGNGGQFKDIALPANCRLESTRRTKAPVVQSNLIPEAGSGPRQETEPLGLEE